jgi:hypothetical protein
MKSTNRKVVIASIIIGISFSILVFHFINAKSKIQNGETSSVLNILGLGFLMLSMGIYVINVIRTRNTIE